MKVDFKTKKLSDQNFKIFGGYIFRYKSGFCRYKSGTTVIYLIISQIQIIHRFAFSDSSIESLTIPSSVAEFQHGWCSSCPNLNEFLIIENEVKNITYSSDKEDEQFVIMKSNSSNDDYDVLLFAKRNIVRVKIPSFIKKISSSAFERCESIEKVEFSENSQLKIICENAFKRASLKEITIPQSVTKIMNCAFSNCRSLTTVNFAPNSCLTLIGSDAFQRSSIDNIIIPANVSEIMAGAFNLCQNLHKIRFESPSKLKAIESLFIMSAIEKVKIPSSVERICTGAFNNCKNLENIEFDEDSKLMVIEESAFAWSIYEAFKFRLDFQCLKKIGAVIFTY